MKQVALKPNKNKASPCCLHYSIILFSQKEISNFLEEILLEAYGPLENVPSWHYSEKEKISSDQTVSHKAYAKLVINFVILFN